jgi:hypothetical protein
MSYNREYDNLPNNMKAYVDMFHEKHTSLGELSESNMIAELIKICEKYPVPNMPDIIKCAKHIQYDIMYKVHIQILGTYLDSAPGLFKGIMSGFD